MPDSYQGTALAIALVLRNQTPLEGLALAWLMRGFEIWDTAGAFPLAIWRPTLFITNHL
jgi:hypothetical protein